MSRRSLFAVNSFGFGLAAPCRLEPPAADPAAPPPGVDPLIDPPGAGADEESEDTALGVIAHPAKMGAVASIRMRAVCEKRFTRVPPFRGPLMGPRFGRGAAAMRQVAQAMPGARTGEIWCNIRQLTAWMVRPARPRRHQRCVGLPERQTVAVMEAHDEPDPVRSEEHTSELQSLRHLVCRLLLEKKNTHTFKCCDTEHI